MNVLLNNIIDFLSVEFSVLSLSMLPVVELRGAIPIGISLGMSPLHAAIVSFIGSMIPVPFILFASRPILNYLKKTKLFRKMVNNLTSNSLKKSDKIQRYGAWGLVLFVAIPIPGTGVWSGSLASTLLDIRFKWSFPAIMLGNIIGAIIIMSLSTGIVNIFN